MKNIKKHKGIRLSGMCGVVVLMFPSSIALLF